MSRVKKIVVGVICTLFLLCAFSVITVYADGDVCKKDQISVVCPDNDRGILYSDPEYKEILAHHETSNPLNSIIRSMGWGIITFFGWVLNSIETFNKTVVEMVRKFLDDSILGEFRKKIDTVSFAALPLIFVFLGISTMIGKHAQSKKAVIQVIVVFLFLSGMSLIYKTGFEMVGYLDTLFQTSDEYSFSDELILHNVYDLEYMREQIEVKQEITDKPNTLTQKQLGYLDINQHAPFETGWMLTKKGLFNRKIVGWDEANDVPIVSKYDNKGFYGFGAEYIYNYKINMFDVLFNQSVMFVVLVMLSYRRTKIVLELGIMDTLKTPVAISSITNKEKLIRFAKKIRDFFIILGMTSFSLFYFIKFTGYLTKLDANFIQKLPLMIANASIVLGSSAILETILGVPKQKGNGFFAKYLGARMVAGAFSKATGFVGNRVNGMKEAKAQRRLQTAQGMGMSRADTIANKRANFLNGDKNIKEYAGHKDEKYLKSGYQYDDLKPNQLQEHLQNMGVSKRDASYIAKNHTDDFNSLGRQAYEKKFPTHKQQLQQDRENKQQAEFVKSIEQHHRKQYGKPTYAETNYSDTAGADIGTIDYSTEQVQNAYGTMQQESYSSSSYKDMISDRNYDENIPIMDEEVYQNVPKTYTTTNVNKTSYRDNYHPYYNNNKKLMYKKIEEARGKKFTDEEKKIASYDWTKNLGEDD